MNKQNILQAIGYQQRLWVAAFSALMAGLLFVQNARAALELPNTATTAPAAQAETIRQTLVQAQLKLQDDSDFAMQQVQDAQDRYLAELAPTISAVTPEVDGRIRSSLDGR